jgi:hypothetical protein
MSSILLQRTQLFSTVLSYFSEQLFCYTTHSYYDFVSRSQDLVKPFIIAIVLSHSSLLQWVRPLTYFVKCLSVAHARGLRHFVKWHSGSTWWEAAHGSVACAWVGGDSVARAQAGAASRPDRGRSGASRVGSRRAGGHE